MPRNINTLLFDRLLAHKVRLVGFENQMGRQVLSLWRTRGVALDDAVYHQWTPYPSQFSVESGVLEMGQIFDDMWDESAALLESSLMGQVDTESRIILRILWASIPQKIWEIVGGLHRFQEAAPGKIDAELFRPIPVKQASKMIREPLAGKNWEARIKLAKGQSRRRLARELTQGMASGEGIPRIKRRIRSVLHMTAKRADTLVRTEVHHVSNRIQERMYEANTTVLSGTEYTATLDDRTCQLCGSHDRDVYYFEGQGSPAYESRPFIPEHPRCRCCYIPVTKFREIFGSAVPPGQRASMFGPVPGRTTYGQWLGKQPKGTIEGILGVKRAALFSSGEVRIKDFVAGNRTRTLAQLEQLALEDAEVL